MTSVDNNENDNIDFIPSNYTNDSENPFVPTTDIPLNTNDDQNEETINESEFGIEGLISDDTLQGRLAREMYGRSKERAQGFVNIYANIDVVRPYFDVEPWEVGKSLLFSIFPFAKKKDIIVTEFDLNEDIQTKKPDLYGPLMLCFTLSAILLLGLKLQNEGIDTTNVEQGTLLSTALFVCFSFWIVSSVIYYFLAFMFNATCSFLHLVSLSGYAQFGVCVSLLVHCFIDGWTDRFIMVFFGGLSALTLGISLFKLTPQKKHGILLLIIAFIMQVSFLIYLKVFYAAISSVEFTDIFNKH